MYSSSVIENVTKIVESSYHKIFYGSRTSREPLRKQRTRNNFDSDVRARHSEKDLHKSDAPDVTFEHLPTLRAMRVTACLRRHAPR